MLSGLARSARPMTSTATRASIRNMGGAGAQGFGGFADAFGDIFGDIFGQWLRRGGAGGAGGPAGVSRRRPALQHGNHARAGGARATTRRSACRAGSTCEVCTARARSPVPSRKPARPVSGSGAVRMSQGLLQHPANVPEVPRHRHLSFPSPARHCHGAGKVKETKTLEVKIPAGIDDGMRIRSAGNGEPGINGGPPGDLYVEIHIKQHSVFERDGDDLHCQMPIPFTTAALGGEIEVPTLAGRASFTVPEGTQSGKTVPVCAARASRACARASPATCTCMCRSKRRSSSPNRSAICSSNSRRLWWKAARA